MAEEPKSPQTPLLRRESQADEKPGGVRLAYITTIPGTQWMFLRGQNAYLSARGFELHAISSPGPRLTAVGERDGATVHPVPIARTIAPLRDLVSLVKLYRTLRRVRPQIVQVSTSKAALLGAIAARLARVPIRVFLVRGLASEHVRGFKHWLFQRLERLTAQLCNSVLCVSPSLLEHAQAEGILRAREGLVPGNGMSNGIDAERFNPETVGPAELPAVDRSAKNGRPESHEFVVGFVGRLADDKGIGDLAAAWRVLRREFVNSRLLLVGAWEAAASVSALVREDLEADPRVIFTGRVEDVAPYYKRMDLFIFPSHGSEGFPNAPTEAACMGIPVVATNVIGCVDSVRDGITGTLVPPSDPEALVEAIRTYLDDGELRKQHGRNGRERVLREFRPETVWEAMYAEYCRLLEANGLPLPEAEPVEPSAAPVTAPSALPAD